MNSKSLSFKMKINNYAKRHHIPAQVVLQNIMFERFLDRLSTSEYKDKFVIKGGMLISALVGLDTRTTMDLDTTLRRLKLTEEHIRKAIDNICNIDMRDSLFFKINSIAPIRKDDVYGGYRVKIEAILAEKVETILSRDTANTRPRDFYDVFILVKKQKYDLGIFRNALRGTSDHRGSWDKIHNFQPIIERIERNEDLHRLWDKYRREFYYAKDINYEETIAVIRDLLK